VFSWAVFSCHWYIRLPFHHNSQATQLSRDLEEGRKSDVGITHGAIEELATVLPGEGG